MTSDAKLGLLLGLILIIAIVFAINGLPGLAGASSGNKINKNIISVASEDIVSTAKETVNILKKHNLKDSIAKNTAVPAATIANNRKLPSAVNISKGYRLYTVEADDNLAVIAKKFYGPELGNKLSNIRRIASFNRLKSLNNIYQGQKLKIPAIDPVHKPAIAGACSQQNSAENICTTRNVIALPAVSVTLPARTYIVRKGDTLWSIARKTLKNASRYREILRANPDITSQDSLKPGTVLKLPEK